MDTVPNAASIDDEMTLAEDSDVTSAIGDEDHGHETHYKHSSAVADEIANLLTLENVLTEATELVSSATDRLKMLNAHSMVPNRNNQGSDIATELAKYKQERAAIFHDHQQGKKNQGQLRAKIKAVKRNITQLKSKERNKRIQQKREYAIGGSKIPDKRTRRAENARSNEELLKFWPKFTFTVSIVIEWEDIQHNLSPKQEASETGAVDIDETAMFPAWSLVLSYLTTGASWSPVYDLQLFSKEATGLLCFDALLVNNTSETWSDCQVTISTSQAAFIGLQETTLPLSAWKVAPVVPQPRTIYGGILASNEEFHALGTWRARQTANAAQPPRHSMFHSVSPPICADQRYAEPTMLLEQQNKKRRIMVRQDHNLPNSQHEQPGTFFAGENQVDFRDSIVEEPGQVSIYELSGLKTLAPKTAPSRQRVVRARFNAVDFQHTVVAKYMPAVTVKAKLNNKSGVTIIKGMANVALDGCFMGRTTLPHCRSGNSFSVDLGIDYAIKLVYLKPEVRRVATGMFSKEESSVFKRGLTLENTRDHSVAILVKDQIPMSEDDRLRVLLRNPPGLSENGPEVAAGEPPRDATDDSEYGEATAVLKANGEVNWQVTLGGGKSVHLPLEYVITLPSGLVAVQT